MNSHTLFIAGALALFASAGVVQADNSSTSSTSSTSVEAVPYHYGMSLDIAKVVSITEQQTTECKVITADMKFIDTAGKLEEITYSKLSDACNYQS